MRSPIYWHPVIYSSMMKVLYGRFFEERYSRLADLLPEHSTVTEVCAGDSYLYLNYLKRKNIRYLGLDINPAFVRHAQNHDVPFRQHDLFLDPVPESDYIIIQGSLCQFMPRHKEVTDKLMAAAKKALLIAEPVRNLSSSTNPIIAFIARYSANAGKGHPTLRFNPTSLLDFFKQYSELNDVFEIKGGREMIGVFKKKG